MKKKIYAGITHSEYHDPLISTSMKDMKYMDYVDSVEITSKDDWIGCMFNDESISLFITGSPEEEKAGWREQFEEQMKNGDSDYCIGTSFGEYFIESDEISSVEEGISYIENCIDYAEADGDSSCGILWFPARDYIKRA